MSEVVLLTGVSGGIGKCMAQTFIAKGHKVIGSDLGETVDSCLSLYDYFQMDLSQLDTVNTTMESISGKYPEITMVVNNAGIANIQPFAEETPEKWQQVMDINFNSLVLSTRYWLNFFMGKGGGHIANMASMAGHISPSGMCSYSASKHAIVGFTESLGLELEALDVPVSISLITPGFIKTDIMRIGEKNGFPEKLQSMTTSPEVAGERIVEALLKKEKHIIPDKSGKVLKTVNRFAPELLKNANKLLAGKIFK